MTDHRRHRAGKPRVSRSALDHINPHAAGIDCGSAEHFVAVPRLPGTYGVMKNALTLLVAASATVRLGRECISSSNKVVVPGPFQFRIVVDEARFESRQIQLLLERV